MGRSRAGPLQRPQPARAAAWLLACGLAACSGSEGPEEGSVSPPHEPAGVTLAVEGEAVVVAWEDGSEDETAFAVARVTLASAGAGFTATDLRIVGSTSAGATRFVDADVEPGLRYAYGVAAFRAGAGASPFALGPAEGVLVPLPGGGTPCDATPTAGDADGDGLSDEEELTGWTVRVDEDGQGTLVAREVQGGTHSGDTDGDGLCDRQESTLRTDPRRADTDGDSLSDRDEIERWGSSPTAVDTDGDSGGNSLFFDGSELDTYGTSPTLADTDADGRSDFQEINQEGTSALVSDLPVATLRLVGKTDVTLDVTLESGEVISNAETAALEQGSTSSSTRSSSVSTQRSIETSISASVTAEASFPAGVSAEVSASVSQTESYSRTSSSEFSRSSVQDAQETFEAASDRVQSQNQTISGGHLGVSLEIANEGTRTFAIRDVVITALTRDRLEPGTFSAVATLALPPAEIVLGEGDRTGPVRAEAEIPGQVALDLLSNPSTLMIRTASFRLTDRTGTDFAFTVGEETAARTALVTLEYGGLRPLDRYRVATNVERGADGNPAGVRLGEVMTRMLGLAPGVGYDTAPDRDGKRVLVRVRDVATARNGKGGSSRFWMLIAGENADLSRGTVSARLLDPDVPFDEKLLMPRDAIFLAYVGDDDGDRVNAAEERLYGSSDAAADSDGDGLSDFDEVRTGWTVRAPGPLYVGGRRVYSSPTARDTDGDGFDDAREREAGSDPNRRDTDGDGLVDPVDPAPAEGPQGSFTVLVGTAGTERVLDVRPGGGRVYVLGTSDGDIDADGVAGGPFVLALDGETGAVAWTTQLETTTDFAKNLAIDGEGGALLLADPPAGALPGGNDAAAHVVRFGPDGGIEATPILTPGEPDMLLPFKTTFHRLERLASGELVSFLTLLRPYPQSGGYAYWAAALALDASGGFIGTTLYGFDDQVVERSASRGGVAIGAWGCYLRFTGARANLDGGSLGPYCPAQAFALDSLDAVHVAVRDGSGADVVRRVSLDGIPRGDTLFAEATFTKPQVTALFVDDADQRYTAVSSAAAAGPVRLYADDAAGTRLWQARFGSGSTRVTAGGRDVVGNLFVGGSSDGGFAGVTGPGGEDVLVIRNPQLRYEVAP